MIPRAAGVLGVATLVASSISAVDGAAYAAPVEIFAAAEQPVTPGNLLPDGRFVTDSTGWTNTRGGTLALSDDAASGEHSLEVTGRENSQSGPFASVAGKLEVGATYRMSGALKYVEGNATQQFNFTFCPTNFNGCADYGHTFTKGEWGTFSQQFTAEAKHAAADWFFVETPWGSGSLQDFKVDDLSLVKIADAPEQPAFTSLEKVQTKPIGDHNPLVGHKFGADPHHLIYNGRLYIYSTDDTQQYELNSKDANGLPTQSNGYGGITRLNVMSTSDMVNWVDHGSIPISRAGGAAPWTGNSWAPAAIEKDGKVYLYFCDSGTGTAVVVGGSPLGPWTDPLGKKIIPDTVSRDYIEAGGFPSGMWLFDPEVFIDDDGQGYLYFGGNSKIGTEPNVQGPLNPKSTRVVKLKEDMVTIDGDPVEIDGPGMFEASSMFKRGDKYYYSYSSNFQVTEVAGQYPPAGAIAYMMTDDPMDLTSAQYAGVAFQNQGTFFGAEPVATTTPTCSRSRVRRTSPTMHRRAGRRGLQRWVRPVRPRATGRCTSISSSSTKTAPSSRSSEPVRVFTRSRASTRTARSRPRRLRGSSVSALRRRMSHRWSSPSTTAPATWCSRASMTATSRLSPGSTSVLEHRRCRRV